MPMRGLVVLCLLLGAAGCTESPASLGITGPAPPTPPPVSDDSTIGLPGVPATTGYGPSIVPIGGGNGHFFNYN